MKKNSEETLETKDVYNSQILKDKKNLKAEVETDDNDHPIETLISPQRKSNQLLCVDQALEEAKPVVTYWNLLDADLQLIHSV